MRPVAELIQELDTEAAKFDMTALVVAFQTRTKIRAFYVWSDDKTKLSNLNILLENGGKPLGFIGLTQEEGAGPAVFYSRPLDELKSDHNVADYLSARFERIKALVPASKFNLVRG